MSGVRTLQDRLIWAQQNGNLTMMDLARWLERSHATVRQWVKGVQLGGAPQDNETVNFLLTRLEVAIRYKKGFPVPRLRPRDRRAYLLKVRSRAITSKLR
jgi:hypothetical protein